MNDRCSTASIEDIYIEIVLENWLKNAISFNWFAKLKELGCCIWKMMKFLWAFMTGRLSASRWITSRRLYDELKQLPLANVNSQQDFHFYILTFLHSWVSFMSASCKTPNVPLAFTLAGAPRFRISLSFCFTGVSVPFLVGNCNWTVQVTIATARWTHRRLPDTREYLHDYFYD